MRTPYYDLLSRNSCRPVPYSSEKSYELQPIVPPPCVGSGRNRTAAKWKIKLANRRSQKNESAIVDSGASGTYLIKNAPKLNEREEAQPIRVGTVYGEAQRSSNTYELAIPNLPSDFPVYGHVKPGFQEYLIGIGPICDADYRVTFTNDAVIIYSPKGHTVLTGWRETEGTRLWSMSLLLNADFVPDIATSPDNQQSTLEAFSAYDIPSVEGLLQYFHAAAGLTVLDNWLKDVKAGNFKSWPGLTYQNAAKYCSMCKETIKVHMVHT